MFEKSNGDNFFCSITKFIYFFCVKTLTFFSIFSTKVKKFQLHVNPQIMKNIPLAVRPIFTLNFTRATLNTCLKQNLSFFLSSSSHLFKEFLAAYGGSL